MTVKHKKLKCCECNKKLNWYLTNLYTCKCNKVYCSDHKMSHRCEFKYDKITSNDKIESSKIDKI